jgi:predicted RNA binding protein YcfA (HicA-like mRNA interferase family)
MAKTQQLADSGHYVVRLRVTGTHTLEDVPNATLNISIPEHPSEDMVLEIISKIKESLLDQH